MTDFTPWKTGRRPGHAFTLVELLVVMAIIVLLAGLIAYLLPAATEKRVRNRVLAEMRAVETAIQQYKARTGYYPPDNRNHEALPPLYYELKGIEPPGTVTNVLAITGIANTGGEQSAPADFYPSLKPSGARTVVTNGAPVTLLVVPYKGPNGEDVNPWRYNSSNPRHNVESFDLWAEVRIGDKVVTIGNWKE